MIASMLLNDTTLFWGWLLYGPILLYAAWRAPWVELFSDNRRQHLLFGTVLVLCILWLVRRDFPSGLSFHFIGMTAVTLLLDWPLAVLAGFIAQLALLSRQARVQRFGYQRATLNYSARIYCTQLRQSH